MMGGQEPQPGGWYEITGDKHARYAGPLWLGGSGFDPDHDPVSLREDLGAGDEVAANGLATVHTFRTFGLE
jgi:hypothetical protein